MQEQVAGWNNAIINRFHLRMIVPRYRIKSGRVVVIDQNEISRRWRRIGRTAKGFQSFQNIMQRKKIFAHGQMRQVGKWCEDTGIWWNLTDKRLLADTCILSIEPINSCF